MPLTARIAIIGTLGLLLGGAVFLLLERGPAILIDLSASAAQLLCL
jgi:hypothetical protein